MNLWNSVFVFLFQLRWKGIIYDLTWYIYTCIARPRMIMLYNATWLLTVIPSTQWPSNYDKNPFNGPRATVLLRSISINVLLVMIWKWLWFVCLDFNWSISHSRFKVSAKMFSKSLSYGQIWLPILDFFITTVCCMGLSQTWQQT